MLFIAIANVAFLNSLLLPIHEKKHIAHVWICIRSNARILLDGRIGHARSIPSFPTAVTLSQTLWA